jgi:hypothetical protein
MNATFIPWRPWPVMRLLQSLPWELAALDLATPGAQPLRGSHVHKFINFKLKLDDFKHKVDESS